MTALNNLTCSISITPEAGRGCPCRNLSEVPMFSALLGSGATHRQPKSSSQVSAAWAGWQQSGLCPLHPRASSQVPAAQPSPAQQRCALLTWHCWQSGYSQNTPEKLGINEAVQCGTCCSKQSPTESLQASSSEGSSAFAPSRQGTAIHHLCHTTSSTWQGRTGQESLSIQTFLPIPSLPAVFPWYSSNICLLLLLNIIFIILVLTLP